MSCLVVLASTFRNRKHDRKNRPFDGSVGHESHNPVDPSDCSNSIVHLIGTPMRVNPLSAGY